MEYFILSFMKRFLICGMLTFCRSRSSGFDFMARPFTKPEVLDDPGHCHEREQQRKEGYEEKQILFIGCDDVSVVIGEDYGSRR